MKAWAKLAIGATLAGGLCAGQCRKAAEITIFTSMGSLSGVTDLAAAYEKASGHKVTVAARIGPALPKALNSNEPGDIVANFTPGVRRRSSSRARSCPAASVRVRARRRRRRDQEGRAEAGHRARSTPSSRRC